MHPISKSDIQRALVNVTKSERSALTVPSGFEDTDWTLLDFYGWRDPKIVKRGYLVRQHDDALVAVAVTTTDGGLVAGRKANTVGTYICTDLDCSAQLRQPSQRVGRTMLDQDKDDDQIAAEMLTRLDAFLDAVRA